MTLSIFSRISRYLSLPLVLSVAVLVIAGVRVGTTANSGGTQVTPRNLLVAQVTTAGITVTAIAPQTAINGCWIQNDPAATTNLVVDAVNVAKASNPAPTAAFLIPGGTFVCPTAFGITTAVTVDASDNSHKFYGQVY